MEEKTTETPVNKRITSIDALRGFALIGIFIVHMMEQYYGDTPPNGVNFDGSGGVINIITNILAQMLIRGKFYAIFSFLFGLSFFIQMDRAAKKGVNLQGRFVWRIAILFAIGFIHGLFFRGDILTIYAMLGLILVFFYKVPTKWLVIIAIVLSIGVPRFLIYGGKQIFQKETVVNQQNKDAVKASEKQALDVVNNERLKFYNAVVGGKTLTIFKLNLTQGFPHKMDFQFGLFSRGYQTLALFFMGLLAGRFGYFEEPEKYRKFNLKMLTYAGITCGVVVGLFVIMMAIAWIVYKGQMQNVQNEFIMNMSITLSDIFNMAITALYIGFFVKLYQKAKAGKILSYLAPYGRAGLTNYFLQTILGVTILFGFGFGFGLIGKFGPATLALMAIGMVALQIIISTFWLKYFNYGLLEWIWRSLTYFKIYPLVKKDN